MLTKKNNKKGFTLMEMLIVVAIIAVLVAIAIPTFSGALTKAKESADVANIRAAYAEWQVKLMTEDGNIPSETEFISGTDLNYDTAPTDNFNYADGVITYTPKKINGGNTYKWTLSAVTIN